ncbi:MAG: LPS assembly lipoprotein LptE [Myxococcota bacterium]
MTFAEYEPLGIAPDIARYLAELAGHEGAQIVFDSAKADETIKGVIRQGRTAALPVVDPQAAIAGYQIVVDIDAQMVDGAGTVLWASTMSFSEDFLPGAGNPAQLALGTETSRRRALDRVAQRAAREIYDRIAMSSAMGVRAGPLQPGKNVPRMSPWAPLPPLTAAGAPVLGTEATTQTAPQSGTYAPPQSPTNTPATRIQEPAETTETP